MPMIRVALIAVFAALTLFGQAFNGSISGIVTDPGGAVVPGTRVTITNIDRNTTNETTTNATGFYRIGDLTPGNYRVSAGITGFQTYILEGFPLATQQQASVNITLQVGQVVEQIKVNAEAQLIEANTSALGGVVDNKRIVDLPLNGRNIYSLTSLVPGVFQTRQTSGVEDTFTANRFIVNGGQESTSDILLDGVSATVAHNIPTVPAVSAIPSVEAIQEFRIQTNAYAAEYGRSGGGLVTLVTKSGTNNLHGSVYEFLRNSAMDANGFFANRSGTQLASFKRNQFGGSAGGPVLIPKVYDGRNKTFFFISYEGMRRRAASFAQHTVPTDLQRAGDFSQTFNANRGLMMIYDPLTTRPDPARPGNFIRDAFAGNRIPVNRFSPVAVATQKYYPAPNSPGAANTAQQNLVLQSAFPEPQDRIDMKVDHNFNDRQRLMGRYSFMDSVYSKPNFWGNPADPGCCEPMNQRLQNAMLDFTQVVGTASVFTLRYGFGRVSGNRLPWSTTLDGQGAFDIKTLGLPASMQAIADQPIFPTFTIQDYTQLGPNGGNFYLMGDSTHSMVATFSSVRGRHSLKFGADIRFNFVNFGQLDVPSGRFDFFRDFTAGPDPRTGAGNSGSGYASFLLGHGGGNNRSAGKITHQIRPANANRYMGFYAQDDFKITKKLTINLGFRWDFESGTTERYDQLTAIDPFIRNPLSDRVGMNLRGGTLFGGDTLGRREIRTVIPTQVNPRIGIAYQLDAATVIRTGYGIFYGMPPYGAGRHYTGAAFQSETPWVSTIDGITPTTSLTNPFPDGYNFFTGRANGLTTQVGFTIWDGWPDALRANYNQQWNFAIQRQFGGRTMMEVAYAGNKGTNLAYFLPSVELNQLNPQLLSMGNALLTQVPNPFHGIVSIGTLSTPTIQQGQLLRPYPQYTGFQAKNAGWANSNYHALLVRFERRFSTGLTLQSSYSYSKTISDAADGLWNMANGIRDFNCLKCERAVSSYDQPHRFVTNMTYELPFGRGQRFGANSHKVVNAAFGGWQVNGILTLSQGLPLRNFTLASNTCFCFGGNQRPNSTGVSAKLSEGQNIDRWFDTAQIVAPASFTFGNLGRTLATVRSDNARNLDFSIFKSFRPTERIGIQFRGEAFNLTNTPLFSQPNTQVGAPLFGRVTGQENTPRQIQLGLKILF
jgi:hypothetical protein